jgi:hypothetical protein
MERREFMSLAPAVAGAAKGEAEPVIVDKLRFPTQKGVMINAGLPMGHGPHDVPWKALNGKADM